jgi:hypothetical protein
VKKQHIRGKMGIITVLKGFLTITIFLLETAFASAIEIKKFACSEFIKNRQPVNITDVFPASVKKIYCFTQVKTDEYPTYIYHIWYYNGKLLNKIKLNIKYSTYRTWSYSRNLGVGRYKVVLADKDGIPLAEREFKVSDIPNTMISQNNQTSPLNNQTSEKEINKNVSNSSIQNKTTENKQTSTKKNNTKVSKEEDKEIEQLEKKLLEQEIKKDLVKSKDTEKNNNKQKKEEKNEKVDNKESNQQDNQKDNQNKQELSTTTTANTQENNESNKANTTEEIPNEEENIKLSNPYGLPSDDIQETKKEVEGKEVVKQEIKNVEKKEEDNSYFLLLLGFYGLFLIVMFYLYKKIFK